MAQFNVHFFKEKSRKIDVDQLISFFERIEGFIVEIDNDSVRMNYEHPRLEYKAKFVITPKSCVPDIYRLSPKFLDLNFHLELSLLTPYYVAKQIFDIVKRVCDAYDFHIYNEMLEDVKPFKIELIMKAFEMLKEAYIKKNPVILADYHRLPKDKSQAIFRYMDDLLELQKYYQELDTYVPKYHILTTEEKEVVFGIEWKEHTMTVFPPYLDYIFYRVDQEIKVVSYEELYPLIEKYVQDVPGFIKGTKVFSKKLSKKVYKVMKKTKFMKINHTFAKENIKRLLD